MLHSRPDSIALRLLGSHGDQHGPQHRSQFRFVVLFGVCTVLLAIALPVVGDSLGTFPLPEFLGLQLSLVDLDRNGEFISLFLDLSPTP